ncbi:helix-turn-helix transcriptional regulator [Sphingomonas sp. LY54]|uniref:ArsR/SmtB family transcription factor n=1 Tax=Sphingomonas sp. LY54 TaxID=3095343 RepID=UPI002D798187|nr:helix-turn-helix transcriptional regulator [Sphingomonas sp. LY54]WRP28722.1 helix-turn-helix transcriptional regulator [Sphingomonas sp. LY54]
MTNVASLASIAALIGEPARAAILVTLMDGRALTAGELGEAAGIAPSTASGHLVRMLDAGLLALERQGRHRYYRLASPSVAGLLESMMSLTGELVTAAGRCRPVRTGPRDQALRRARLCYDHLAGEVAVGIAASMTGRGELEFDADGGALTGRGMDFLASLGVDLDASAPAASRRAFCRPCLDWSERRPHVAGTVGRALYACFLGKGWLRRSGTGRALLITPPGQAAFERHFGLAPA